MTEDQIERRVERMMDHLDRLLISGQMPQRDYALAVADLNRWAEEKRRPSNVLQFRLPITNRFQ